MGPVGQKSHVSDRSHDPMPRQLIHHGRKIDVYLDTAVLPDGTTVRRDSSSTRCGRHPAHGRRFARLPASQRTPGRRRDALEQPAGTLEPGEPPEGAAVRELTEETGYTAARLAQALRVLRLPGLHDRAVSSVRGPGADARGSARRNGTNTWSRTSSPGTWAISWTLDGTIRDAKTIAGLLLGPRSPHPLNLRPLTSGVSCADRRHPTARRARRRGPSGRPGDHSAAGRWRSSSGRATASA